MKKSYAHITVLVLICALCLAVFAGCGGEKVSDEELISKNIEEVLGLGVTAEELATGFREDAEFVELAEQAQIDIDAYAEALAKHFSAEIKSVAVDGKSALATITVNAPDFAAMNDVLDEKLDEMIEEMDPEDITEENLMAKMGELMVSIFDDPDCKIATSDIEVPYVKNGKAWEMEDQAAAEAALSAILENF